MNVTGMIVKSAKADTKVKRAALLTNRELFLGGVKQNNESNRYSLLVQNMR
jgi:hypothetical protein